MPVGGVRSNFLGTLLRSVFSLWLFLIRSQFEKKSVLISLLVVGNDGDLKKGFRNAEASYQPPRQLLHTNFTRVFLSSFFFMYLFSLSSNFYKVQFSMQTFKLFLVEWWRRRKGRGSLGLGKCRESERWRGKFQNVSRSPFIIGFLYMYQFYPITQKNAVLSQTRSLSQYEICWQKLFDSFFFN